MTTAATGRAAAPEPASLGDLTVRELLDRLASDRPVPGGGSASAIAAGLAAALVSMVAELSVAYAAEHGTEPTRAASAAAGRRLAAHLVEVADADAAAFAGFGSAMRLPRDTDEERAARSRAIRAAARSAAEAPLACMEACLEIVRAAEALAGRSNPNLASDLVVASVLAEAAGRGAGANVEVNLPLAKDEAWAATMTGRAATLQAAIDGLGATTRQIVASRSARPPEQGSDQPEGGATAGLGSEITW